MKYFDEKSINSAKQDFPNIVRQATKGYEVIASNFKSPGSGKVSIISTDIYEFLANTKRKK